MIKVIRQRLRRLLAFSSGSFVSYKPFLRLLCENFQPESVLEFGPGKSTAVILRHSRAKILSIETSADWFNRYKQKADARRVELLYREPGWDMTELDRRGERFDVIFVDGGDRLAALRGSPRWLADDGVVFLHDAHREDYEPGIRVYQHVYFPERHSCILTANAATAGRLRDRIPPDYSCKCRYCGSPERQAYLAQFIGDAAFRR